MAADEHPTNAQRLLRPGGDPDRTAESTELPITPRLLGRLSVDPARARRLEGAYGVLKVAIDERDKTIPSPPGTAAAKRCLEKSAEAIKAYQHDIAWTYLMAAERHLIDGYGDAELHAHSTEVFKEAVSKLTDWRRESIMAILGPLLAAKSGSDDALDDGKSAAKTSEERTAEHRAKLKEASRLRDDHFMNVYRKIEIRRKLLLITATILALALALAYVIAGVDSKGDQVQTSAFPGDSLAVLRDPQVLLGSQRTLIGIMLLGLFGALISIAVSLANTQDSGKRLPEHIASTNVTLARPVFGAGFAVAIYLAMNSGVVSLFHGDPKAFALAAFLAGFSERWFLGIVSGALGSKQ